MPLVATIPADQMTTYSYPNDSSFKIRSRGRIPHWEVDDGIYFVTFRLFDSLPVEAVNRLEIIRARFLRRSGSMMSESLRLELDRALFRETEAWLDGGHGSCFLRDPRIAGIVQESLHYFDNDRYRMLSWAIMPNHVHTVFVLFNGGDLARVLKSWKQFTSRESNKLLGRTGQRFWEREYFDRLVRNEDQLGRTIRYVMNNPAKAGLHDWAWTWQHPELVLT